MELLRQEIIACHLRYSDVGLSLRQRANAAIIEKAILLNSTTEYVKVGKIRQAVSEILGGANLSHEDIRDGLTFLDRAGAVERSGNTGAPGNKWRIRRPHRVRREADIERRRERARGVYERHFPQDIPFNDWSAWFDSTCVDFLSQFSDYWVPGLCTRESTAPPDVPKLDLLIQKSIKSCGFDGRRRDLLTGFRTFLESTQTSDSTHFWDLGMSAFASRLVAAGIGSDPITTRELRDSQVLLDTNVLIAIALEANRHQEPLVALGCALEEIGAELCYVNPTKEEYRRVTAHWKANVLAMHEKYGPDVLRDSKDETVQTAVIRHCYSFEDYETFFEQLLDPPSSLGGLAITLVDDQDLAKAAAKGEGDSDLVKQIRDHWRTRHPNGRLKAEHATRHDASLTGVARALREQARRCWILTLDWNMQDLGLQWSAATDAPLWISLHPLLQILAVDYVGTSVDPVKFAPLLARLIVSEIHIPEDDFTVDDLKWLGGLERDVTGMPPDLIKSLAREIHRARLQGARRRDPELALSIERIYQRGKEKLQVDIETATQRAARAEDEREAMRTSSDRLRVSLVNEIKKNLRQKERWKLARRCVLPILGGVVVSGGFVLVRARLWPEENLVDLLNMSITVLTVILAPVSLIWKWAVPSYRRAIAGLQAAAEAQADVNTGY